MVNPTEPQTIQLAESTHSGQKRPYRHWTPTEDSLLVDKYGSVRLSILARQLGRTRLSLYHRAEDLGLPSPRGSGEFLRRQSLPRTAVEIKKNVSPSMLGYLAGIVDGEGSITRPPKVQLVISTTTKELVEYLREQVGGSVAGPYRLGRMLGEYRTKPQYHWQITSGSNLLELLKSILPLLVVKRHEAKEAIRHLEEKFQR